MLAINTGDNHVAQNLLSDDVVVFCFFFFLAPRDADKCYVKMFMVNGSILLV